MERNSRSEIFENVVIHNEIVLMTVYRHNHQANEFTQFTEGKLNITLESSVQKKLVTGIFTHNFLRTKTLTCNLHR